ncbi:MAG: AAA family ATPase, partial [Leptospiraceae bacterium]|nr:AAA family ATPase [Leptospiraceae bacterium]
MSSIMIKFPYGIMDFDKIITGGYFYQDRTAFIEKCENSNSTLFCVRPRRMGKTL